jgi:hypothetical protein
MISDDVRRGDSRIAPTTTKDKTLGGLIGAFKTVSTKHINEFRGSTESVVWQRNYDEFIIRDEDELNRIRRYIARNSLNWASDKENPAAVKPATK